MPSPPTLYLFPGMTAVVGLILFGSRARADHSQRSDFDFLGIAHGGPPARITRGPATMSVYPLAHVLERARAGDLFAWHLVSEGRVLFETEPVFERIKASFRLRPDYCREIGLASDVGWTLVHHAGRFDDPGRFNKKMAWCTHTMIVARAAAAREPVFSSAGLARFACSDDVGRVIDGKRDAEVSDESVERFRQVLERFGTGEPPALGGLDAELRRFEAVGNAAGTSAVRALRRRLPE